MESDVHKIWTQFCEIYRENKGGNHMKRVVKKTIATVLSSAMLFGTMLSGGAAPVFAEVFAPDTEDLAFAGRHTIR